MIIGDLHRHDELRRLRRTSKDRIIRIGALPVHHRTAAIVRQCIDAGRDGVERLKRDDVHVDLAHADISVTGAGSGNRAVRQEAMERPDP